jgi:hypothetical protein
MLRFVDEILVSVAIRRQRPNMGKRRLPLSMDRLAASFAVLAAAVRASRRFSQVAVGPTFHCHCTGHVTLLPIGSRPFFKERNCE